MIEKTLSTEEVCKMLGVSKPTLYRYCRDGKLTPTRVGRFNRFPEHQIAELLGVECFGISPSDPVPIRPPDTGPGDDKETICRGLLAALQATRHYADLVSLHYEKNRRMEVVIASFECGDEITIDVTSDSGVSMIRDIIRGLSAA